MSKKPESLFWGELKKGFSSLVHCTRVENYASSGMPDVNAARMSREVWMELKVLKSGRITVRHSQINWMLQRVRFAHACNVFIVAKEPVKEEIHVWKATTLLPVAYAAQRNGGPRVRVDDDCVEFPPCEPNKIFKGGDIKRVVKLEEYLFTEAV